MKTIPILLAEQVCDRSIVGAPENRLPIDIYAWGGEYRPESWAELYFVQGEGFLVRLTSYEVNPKAVYTETNSPVHLDSCLEFFCNFCPDDPEAGYINFEANANGTTHCEYGKERTGRFPISDVVEPPKPQVIRGADYWMLEYRVSLGLLEKIYGKVPEFKAGYRILANFYKCGDETEVPHYGSWAKVGTEQPDYHQPKYFDELILIPNTEFNCTL